LPLASHFDQPGRRFRRGIQDKVRNGNFGGAEFTRAAKQSAETGEQFPEFERFGEVVVRAMIEACDAVLDGIRARSASRWACAGRISESSRHTSKPLRPGIMNVENHQIVRVDRCLNKARRLPVPATSHKRRFAHANLWPRSRDARIVFDEQKPHASIIRQVRGKVRYLLSVHDFGEPFPSD